MIEYGYGYPTEQVTKSVYVDMETDTMYRKEDGVWVIYAVNGVIIGGGYESF